MIELIGIVVFMALIAAGGAFLLLPWSTLATVGMWLIIGGAALGVPTGVLYHWRLYQALEPKGVLPEGWYWRPIELNALLDEGEERRRVMFWCGLGAAGFVVIVLGLVALGGAATLVFLRPDA